MTDTIRDVQKLQQVLTVEAGLIHQLVALTEQERTALQAEGLAELTVVTREKEAALHQLTERETVRGQIVAGLVERLNLAPNVSLSELLFHLEQIPGFPDDLKARLTALYQEVVSAMEQLLILNHGNRPILETGLARVNATFDYLAAIIVPHEAGAYTASGQTPAKSKAAAGNMLNWQI